MSEAVMQPANALTATVPVCGVPVDNLTLPETVDRICGFVERGRATGRTHQVATVNVDFVVNALADPVLLTLLQRADLAIPDGMPLVWGSRLLGSPLKERVAGADLVPALARECALRGYRMYLFGGAPGVAERAATILRSHHFGLQIVGDSGPLFSSPQDMDPKVVDDMVAARPDIVCVALGHPKQETWIDLYRHRVKAPVMIGVGGSLDFLTGTQRRAPRWMQRTGTEWFYRTLREPSRFAQRYTRDFVQFGPRLLQEFLLMRTPEPGEVRPPIVDRFGNITVVRPQGELRLDAETLGWSGEFGAEPPPGHQVVIDCSQQTWFDHREVCALVGLAKQLQAAGGELSLASVSAELARELLELRLYGFVSTASGPGILPSRQPHGEAAGHEGPDHQMPPLVSPSLAEGA